MSRRFNVTCIQPAGSNFAECFREMAETVTFGLHGLGHDAELTVNQGNSDATNIIFGAHMLPEKAVLPSGSIIYNWEQIGAYEAKAHYYELAKRYTVWDYSAKNVLEWRRFNVAAKHVPLGYAPEMTRIEKRINEDIPVLFCGTMNDRRMNILNDLLDSGVRFEWPSPCFGAERDNLVSRSKVILNVHFYDANILEMSRVSYMLANRKAVVSEYSEDAPGTVRNAIEEVPYKNLVDACQELVYGNSKRTELEQRGFDIFSKIDEKRILEEALG